MAAWWSTKWRTPAPSKKAMPQPSWWVSVRPPRRAKPVKLNTMSVGTLQFMARSWHMASGGEWDSRTLPCGARAAQGRPRTAPARQAAGLMQQHRLAHQRIVAAEEFVDFRHRRLAGDQLVDVAAEMLRQHAGDEGFALASLVDDFIAAETQGVEFAVRAEFDHAVLFAVVDEVHDASFSQGTDHLRRSEPIWGSPQQFQGARRNARQTTRGDCNASNTS